jgi:amidase
MFSYSQAQSIVLLCEFKVKIAEYLSGLAQSACHTLSDLIAFNRASCRDEMKYFGQEVFELADATSGDLTDPTYLQARARCVQLARNQGIDAALQRDQLDAVVAPSYSLAATTAAVAGYPNISVPVGLTVEGQPAGIWMYGGFLSEPKLLAFAYDLEQEIKARRPPQYLNAAPPEPPDVGLCDFKSSGPALGIAVSPTP